MITTIALSATMMVSGFARGVLREQVALRRFGITQHPVTRAEYGECVEAGACADEREGGCDARAYELIRGRASRQAGEPADVPVHREAEGYCRWIGGGLPTLPEWLLAARGGSPQRYAWGDGAATCEQHPRAADMSGAFPSDEKAQEAGCVPAPTRGSSSPSIRRAPRLHRPAGRAADARRAARVAATPVRPAATASTAASCTAARRARSTPCSRSASRRHPSRSACTPHVYGFRCVLKEGN